MISAITQSLHRNYSLQTPPAADFWKPETLEQHIQAQHIRPITSIEDLKADFWPEDESVDDCIEYIYQQRQDGLRR